MIVDRIKQYWSFWPASQPVGYRMEMKYNSEGENHRCIYEVESIEMVDAKLDVVFKFVEEIKDEGVSNV